MGIEALAHAVPVTANVRVQTLSARGLPSHWNTEKSREPPHSKPKMYGTAELERLIAIPAKTPATQIQDKTAPQKRATISLDGFVIADEKFPSLRRSEVPHSLLFISLPLFYNAHEN